MTCDDALSLPPLSHLSSSVLSICTVQLYTGQLTWIEVSCDIMLSCDDFFSSRIFFSMGGRDRILYIYRPADEHVPRSAQVQRVRGSGVDRVRSRLRARWLAPRPLAALLHPRTTVSTRCTTTSPHQLVHTQHTVLGRETAAPAHLTALSNSRPSSHGPRAVRGNTSRARPQSAERHES